MTSTFPRAGGGSRKKNYEDAESRLQNVDHLYTYGMEKKNTHNLQTTEDSSCL